MIESLSIESTQLKALRWFATVFLEWFEYRLDAMATSIINHMIAYMPFIPKKDKRLIDSIFKKKKKILKIPDGTGGFNYVEVE